MLCQVGGATRMVDHCLHLLRQGQERETNDQAEPIQQGAVHGACPGMTARVITIAQGIVGGEHQHTRGTAVRHAPVGHGAVRLQEPVQHGQLTGIGVGHFIQQDHAGRGGEGHQKILWFKHRLAVGQTLCPCVVVRRGVLVEVDPLERTARPGGKLSGNG